MKSNRYCVNCSTKLSRILRKRTISNCTHLYFFKHPLRHFRFISYSIETPVKALVWEKIRINYWKICLIIVEKSENTFFAFSTNDFFNCNFTKSDKISRRNLYFLNFKQRTKQIKVGDVFKKLIVAISAYFNFR